MGDTNSGKHWINNGKIQKFSETCPPGFVFGRLVIPPQTPEANLKRSLKMRGANNPFFGKHHTEEQKKKWSEDRKLSNLGEKNPFYGKHHTEETKKKLSEKTKQYTATFGSIRTGAILTADTKEKISKKHKGKILSEETKRKIGKASKGRVHSPETKEKMRSAQLNKTEVERIEIVNKQFKTKKENNNFKTSAPEEKYYIYLCEKYGKDNVFRQYRDERYPFHCDFYVKPEDLFIELNITWTHGGKPFDSTSIEDLQKLEKWEEKAKTSEYYKGAIKTWTISDIEKFKIARENNLNYKVYYKIDFKI